jgi:hypothetical protein
MSLKEEIICGLIATMFVLVILHATGIMPLFWSK